MKDKIMNCGLIHWITHWKICQWASNHPVFGKFCNYEFISYVICGVLTTVVNYVCYFLFKGVGLDIIVSNVLSWIFAVLFAFFVNKIFVFLSTSWQTSTLIHELWTFIGCRVASGVMDTAFMEVTVHFLSLNEPLMKLVSNVFVMIVNYFASKLVIFKDRSKGNS